MIKGSYIEQMQILESKINLKTFTGTPKIFLLVAIFTHTHTQKLQTSLLKMAGFGAQQQGMCSRYKVLLPREKILRN
uniref:Uncharacterized protein n=1 Tax=Octopus bimaculoides TaxID=37653 RepID=A0A0L8HW11_OCTBM